MTVAGATHSFLLFPGQHIIGRVHPCKVQDRHCSRHQVRFTVPDVGSNVRVKVLGSNASSLQRYGRVSGVWHAVCACHALHGRC